MMNARQLIEATPAQREVWRREKERQHRAAVEREALEDEANEARYCASERRHQKLIEADLIGPEE